MDILELHVIPCRVSNYLPSNDLAGFVQGDSKSTIRKDVRVQVSSLAYVNSLTLFAPFPSGDAEADATLR